MSMFVNFVQAADIKTLQRAARTLKQHGKGTRQHTSALAQYNVAFNKLHDQGMRPADILRLVGVDNNDYKSNGGNNQ